MSDLERLQAQQERHADETQDHASG